MKVCFENIFNYCISYKCAHTSGSVSGILSWELIFLIKLIFETNIYIML